MTALTDAIEALSPTHYWKLDETSGSTANDTGSGTTRDMTHTNSPTLAVDGPTPDDVGVQYDGVNQLTDLTLTGGASDIGTSNTGTMLYFFKENLFTQKSITFTTTSSNGLNWQFRVDNGFARSVGVLNSGGSSQSFELADTSYMTVDSWHMVALAHSGTVMTGWGDDGFIPAGNFVLSGSGAPDGSDWIDDPTFESSVNRFSFGAFNGLTPEFGNIAISNVAYFDGTALSESQLQTVFDAFVAGNPPIPAPSTPAIKNTWNATLSALNPHHWWLGNEVSGDRLDTGATGGLDMIETDGDGQSDLSRIASSPIRGEPLEYGFWGQQAIGTGLFRSISGINSTGVLTGCVGGVIYPWSTTNEIGYIFNQSYTSPGLLMSLRVNNDKSIEFIVDGGSDEISCKTLPVTFLQPMVVSAFQRADGTGMHIWINGVDATDSQNIGGSATVDSFIDDIIPTDTPGSLGVNAFNSSASGGLIVSNPHVFLNTVPSGSQLAALAASANITGAPIDYQHTMFDLFIDADTRLWMPGWIAEVNGDPLNIAPFFTEGDNPGSPGSGQINVIASGGVGKQVISKYNQYLTDFASNTGWGASFYEPVDTTDTIGTINFIGKIKGFFSNGEVKDILNMGRGGSEANNFENFYLRAIGNADGTYNLNVEFNEEASTGEYIIQSDDSFEANDSIVMITAVQDGTGITVYRNAEVITTSVISDVGSRYSATSWLAEVFDNASAIQFALSIGGRAGSTQLENLFPAEMDNFYISKRIATSSDVSTLYDAINGIFPALEEGAYTETLLATNDGPDWWWRCNETSGQLADSGIAQNRMVSPIVATTILANGAPIYNVAGPLLDDPTNAAIYFDGIGDSFEVGVNGISGELCDTSTGTVGAFFSRNSLDDENIIYSQSDDTYTAYWTLAVNGDKAELSVQTSAGNKAVYLSSIVLNTAFHYIVVSSNGSSYQLYIDGALDTAATITLTGTGDNGDWFDVFTATRSAIAARANSSFTTETTGRISEPFIFDGDILTAAQVDALYEAAITDGITGTPNTLGVLSFENVTFLNGSLADIFVQRQIEGQEFQQVVQVNRCNFLGGAQGGATFRPRSARIRTPAHVQFKGCNFDLNLDVGEAVGFGRGGINCTAPNSALTPTELGSLIVSDCTFNNMGYRRTSDDNFLAPAMAQSAFTMNVEGCRFTNSNGVAIGWRGGAQRITVVNNIIDVITNALGAIRVIAELNSQIGSSWLIHANEFKDIDGDAINILGASVDGNFARNIAIIGNVIEGTTAVAISLTEVGDVMIADNVITGCTEGVRLKLVQSSINVRRNQITSNTADGIILDEATQQVAVLNVDGNVIQGTGNSITIDNVHRLILNGNKVVTSNIAIQIGEITLQCLIDNNQVAAATTPFDLVAGTTQTGLVIGTNQIESLGDQTNLVITTTAITVVAHYHSISSVGATDLATISGPLVDGFLVVLRRAAFSDDITVKDSATINLAGSIDFVMDADNDQLWLVRDGANWNEVSRFEA